MIYIMYDEKNLICFSDAISAAISKYVFYLLFAGKSDTNGFDDFLLFFISLILIIIKYLKTNDLY